MDNEQPLLDSFSLTPARFWQGAVDLFRSPKELLRSMTKEGGYGKPIVYALLWQYVAAGLALLITFIRPLPTPWGVMGNVLTFLLTPPLLILVGFLFAAVIFVVWHLMGSVHGFQTSFRFWALLAPLSVVGVLLRQVPYLGLVVTVFYVYLLVTASIEIHAIRPTKAWTVWGVLFLVFTLLLIVAGVVGAVRGRMPSLQNGSPSSMGRPAGMPLPPPTGPMMNPEELQNRAKAEFERMKRESKPPAPDLKKGTQKR
ncbi:MAG: hypothetical protein JNK54_00825 [Elusimicrobia bacterium]|jgi:hypothetical protein|nr:hypothetical protein [Elusimicrobiota bacterium]